MVRKRTPQSIVQMFVRPNPTADDKMIGDKDSMTNFGTCGMNSNLMCLTNLNSIFIVLRQIQKGDFCIFFQTTLKTEVPELQSI
jgi:hypothetical protein